MTRCIKVLRVVVHYMDGTQETWKKKCSSLDECEELIDKIEAWMDEHEVVKHKRPASYSIKEYYLPAKEDKTR